MSIFFLGDTEFKYTGIFTLGLSYFSGILKVCILFRSRLVVLLIFCLVVRSVRLSYGIPVYIVLPIILLLRINSRLFAWSTMVINSSTKSHLVHAFSLRFHAFYGFLCCFSGYSYDTVCIDIKHSNDQKFKVTNKNDRTELNGKRESVGLFVLYFRWNCMWNCWISVKKAQ